MRSRTPPTPASYVELPKLRHDPQVRKWVQRLLGDPEAKPSDLDETQLAFVHQQVMQRRKEDFEPSVFQRKMVETCPILAAPDFTDPGEDLGHIFALPEMREFWSAWQGRRPAKRPAPNYPGAKAVMSVLAMAGFSAHVDDAHLLLADSPAVKRIFDRLEGGSITLPAYSSTCRLMPRLSENDRCRFEAMRANVSLLRWLREHHPQGDQIGRRLLVDASPVPAWVEQRSAGSRDDPAYARREERLRRRAREAGFRAYIRDAAGKRSVDGSARVRVDSRVAKAWRGYYFALILDQATGLALVWMLFDASVQETSCLVPLLSDLHALWPDIGAEVIAGDSAFSTNENCRLVEVDYGIASAFRLDAADLAKRTYVPLEPGASRDGSVAAITPCGQLVCDAHRRPLEFAGAERPTRGRLAPGQSSEEGKHRVRGLCRHTSDRQPRPCGKLSLRMKVNWHRLTTLPHFADGNPEQHAFRLAMQARLNQVEGFFNRLKSGLHLGGEDETRTRILSRPTYEALFSLGALSLTALAVADQRIALGSGAPSSSPDAQAALDESEGLLAA